MSRSHKYIYSRLFHLAVVWLVVQTQATGQQSPLVTFDAYFGQLSGTPDSALALFRPEARIVTITYDEDRAATASSLSVPEFLGDLTELSQDYDIHLEPLVVIYREYGSTVRAFCSVYGRFASLGSSDSLLSRSVQSFTLVEFRGTWKISGITIQNESPGMPLPSQLWPTELTAKLLNSSFIGQQGTKTYDPDRIFNESEVDELPVYPGDGQLYQSLLKAFDTSDASEEDKKPFTIIIEEDGQAYIDSVNELSKKQAAKATSLVASMLLWYPAIVDKASVKCRKTLYIGE